MIINIINFLQKVSRDSIFCEKFLNLLGLIIAVSAFIFTTGSESFAAVEQKQILLKKNQWTALSSLANGKKICYAINYSYETIGNAAFDKTDKTKKSYIDIDYLGKNTFKLSIHFQKTLGTNSRVFLNIDDEQFELETYKNFGFFKNNEYDARILSLIKNGQKIIARATYSDNSYSVETFDITRFNDISTKLLSSCK